MYTIVANDEEIKLNLAANKAPRRLPSITEQSVGNHEGRRIWRQSITIPGMICMPRWRNRGWLDLLFQPEKWFYWLDLYLDDFVEDGGIH